MALATGRASVIASTGQVARIQMCSADQRPRFASTIDLGASPTALGSDSADVGLARPATPPGPYPWPPESAETPAFSAT